MKQRVFSFPGRPAMWQALQAIAAALADEGLALSTANTPDRPRSVIVGNELRVIVPGSRIVRA